MTASLDVRHGRIERDPAGAALRPWDLIVIGGGIHGICLALEAARRGLQPLLLERDDFGGGASRSTARILHGGLRHLSYLDLRRFRASVAERRWFLRRFPELVAPLGCLMPLYGQGVDRRWLMAPALAVNDLLSAHRNDHMYADHHVPDSELLTAGVALERCALLDPEGLRGAALWFDAVAHTPQRLLMEMLRWACSAGGGALSYVEASELTVEDGQVEGVEAVDRLSGETLQLSAPVVVSCAGGEVGALAAQLDRAQPELPAFRPTITLLLDRPPESELCITVRRATSGPLFVLPWRSRVLAGPFVLPQGAADEPTAARVAAAVDELKALLPGLQASTDEVLRVYPGRLPLHGRDVAGTTRSSAIIAHARRGGPRGLFSICSGDLATARLVAERALAQIFPQRKLPVLAVLNIRPLSAARFGLDLADPADFLKRDRKEAARLLSVLMDEEAVLHLDDLLLRRTDWAADPVAGTAVGVRVCDLLEWKAGRRQRELERLSRVLDRAVPRSEALG